MGKSRGRSNGAPETQSINGLNSSQYWVNDQIKRDVTCYNFSYPIGMQTQYYPGASRIIPSMISLEVQPAMGISNSVKSPAYQNARILFDKIVRMNNAVPPYDPVDLQVFLMAMAEVWGFWRHMQRIYKLSNTYDPINLTMPETILSSMGITAADIRRRKTEIRAWINDFALRMTTISFPTDVDLFSRKDELYLGIYGDENSEKAQFYVFNPIVFYKLNEKHVNGTSLEPIPVHYVKNTASNALPKDKQFNEAPSSASGAWLPRTTTHKPGEQMIDVLMNIGDSLLNALLGSQDVTRICADIRNAYSSFQTVDMLAEDAECGRWHNYAMLTQIENARIVPQAFQVTLQDGGNPNSHGPFFPWFTQEPGVDKGHLVFSYESTPRGVFGQNGVFSTMTDKQRQNATDLIRKVYASPKLLNLHSTESPDADAVMIMTRLLPTIKEEGSLTPFSFTVNGCGTELIVNAEVYYMNASGVSGTVGTGFTYASLVNMSRYGASASAIVGPDRIRAAYLGDQFSYCPARLLLDCTNARNTDEVLDAVNVFEHYDIDRFALADNASLELLHYNALLGQFRAPGYTYNSNKNSK